MSKCLKPWRTNGVDHTCVLPEDHKGKHRCECGATR